MTSTERELVRALVCDAREGRQEAFRGLVERFQPRLLGLVSLMVRDAGAAEEIVQDALVRAYTHLDRYDERRELFPWLATIAVRLAQNWLRRRRRTSEHEAGGVSDALPDKAAPDPLTDAIAAESRRNLWQSVSALPQGERTAIYLCYAQGMRIGEIATTLGVTGGTVKTWLFRARNKLSGQLTAADGMSDCDKELNDE